MRHRIVEFLMRPVVRRVGAVLWVMLILLLLFVSMDPRPFLKFGYWGVLVFNFLGPGTVLIPILAPRMDLVVLAAVSAFGMTLNDSVSWLVGREGDVILPEWVKRWHLLELIRRAHPTRAFFVMMVLAVIPVPLDVIGLVAGYTGLRFWPFVVASLIGKFTRFMLLGGIVLWLDVDVVEWVRWVVGGGFR